MTYDKALSEIDKYRVSPEIQEIKDEFKASLENYRMFGYYTSKGARESNPDDRALGINFWQLALGNWSKGIRLLEQYKNNGNIKPTVVPTAKPLTLYEWTVKEFAKNQDKNNPNKREREYAALQIQIRQEAEVYQQAYIAIRDMNVDYQVIKNILENMNNMNIRRLEEVRKINPNASIVKGLENIIKGGEIAMKTLEIRGTSESIEWKSKIPADFNEKFFAYIGSKGYSEIERAGLEGVENNS